MKHTIASLALISLAFSCSKKSQDAATTTPTTTDTATPIAIADVKDVSQLKLSSLALKLPAALDGTASSLRLADAKKSMDACQMGGTVKEVTSGVGEVANFACHIEVEKDKIEIGKKIKLLLASGEEFGHLWVDRQGDKISFNICQYGDHESKQTISVTKVTSVGAAGSVYEAGTEKEGDNTNHFKRYLTFDFSAEGAKLIDSSDAFSQGDDQAFYRRVKLSLVDGGVSTAALASKGTWQGQSFSQRGAGKFNATYGETLFQNHGSSVYNGQTFDFNFVQRSTFDSAGVVAADDATADFLAPSGALYVAKSDVPDYISESTDFGKASDWVEAGCPDTEVDVTLDPESAAHQACEVNKDNSYDCSNNDQYQPGTESHDLD